MDDEIEILRDISGRFDSAGISYMLTGSMAMNFYSQPRMTRDVDIVVELLLGDVDRVIKLFSPDYYVSREAVEGAVSAMSIFNVIHQKLFMKVDCIVRKPAEFRLVEFARRKKIQIMDFSTWIVSKEDLIISKLEWARDSHSEVQLRDVRSLLSGVCDVGYLQNWTQKLGLNNLLEECLHG